MATLAEVGSWSPRLAEVVNRYAGSAALFVEHFELRRLREHLFSRCHLTPQDLALFDALLPDDRDVICRELDRLLRERVRHFQEQQEARRRAQASVADLRQRLVRPGQCQSLLELGLWAAAVLSNSALAESLIAQYCDLRTEEGVRQFARDPELAMFAFRQAVLRLGAEREPSKHRHPPHRASSPSEMWAFGVLGISPGAGAQEVTRQFRLLAKQHHPDRGGDEERMQEINEAYAVIRRQLAKHRIRG